MTKAIPKILVVIGKIEQTTNLEEKFKLLLAAEDMLDKIKSKQGRNNRLIYTPIIGRERPFDASNKTSELINVVEAKLGHIYQNV